MGALFALLLIFFVAAFFGLEAFVVNYLGAADVRVMGLSLLSPDFRIFLGSGIIFCEFVIVIFFLLDYVGDTIKQIIKPLVRTVPLLAFLTTTYNTFSPIIFGLLPEDVADMAGATRTTDLAFFVTSNTFSEGILLTLFTMLLFVITTRALGDTASPRVRQLEAQIKQYKKELRRGL